MPRSSKDFDNAGPPASPKDDNVSVRPLRAWRSGAMPSRGGVRSSTRSPKGMVAAEEEDADPSTALRDDNQFLLREEVVSGRELGWVE